MTFTKGHVRESELGDCCRCVPSPCQLVELPAERLVINVGNDTICMTDDNVVRTRCSGTCDSYDSSMVSDVT